jgi:predicted TIM-barrel enzyme
MRINCISNFTSINDIMQDRELTKALVVDNFFDTSYIKKIKKEAVSYPVFKELEK